MALILLIPYWGGLEAPLMVGSERDFEAKVISTLAFILHSEDLAHNSEYNNGHILLGSVKNKYI